MMTTGSKTRAAIAALAVSATGFAAYLGYEGWSGTATPPVKGDVPTYGFGSTRGADGKPLRGGETISPPQAVRLALRDLQAAEGGLRKCLDGVELFQHEYDAYASLALNVGHAAVCASSIPAKLRAGEYTAACRTIQDFSKFCVKPKTRDARGKLVCPAGALREIRGLRTRREREYLMCTGIEHEQ
ncbi:MAG: glycoside hydrolase family protein [Azoarcus sp.]|jgi:lysozyme|nr:glycoside hydrolase family protein [Azoarcus sp.]